MFKQYQLQYGFDALEPHRYLNDGDSLYKNTMLVIPTI